MELKLPAEGKTAAAPKPGELKMAAQLISDMTGQVHALHRCSRLPFHPSALKD